MKWWTLYGVDEGKDAVFFRVNGGNVYRLEIPGGNMRYCTHRMSEPRWSRLISGVPDVVVADYDREHPAFLRPEDVQRSGWSEDFAGYYQFESVGNDFLGLETLADAAVRRGVRLIVDGELDSKGYIRPSFDVDSVGLFLPRTDLDILDPVIHTRFRR